MLLVLLRTAIGWHFLYEGVEKVYSTPEGRDSWLARLLPRPSKPEPPFSAEGYLRAATGPLAPRFRAIVPNVDGLETLNLESLKRAWERDLERHAAHYRFNDTQRQQARQSLDERVAIADAWFRELENAERIKKYRDGLARVDAILASPRSLSFEREQAYKDRKQLDADRRELNATVDGWTAVLRDRWTEIHAKSLPADKAAALMEKTGRPVPLWTQLDYINAITKYGMIAVGVGLMLGLFTRLSALGAAGFLAMFYLSMPPWPGLPAGAMQEGHYLIVNKNLIELLACLFIASTPSGLWVGLDAILFGARARRRRAEEALEDQIAESPRVVVPNPSARTKSR